MTTRLFVSRLVSCLLALTGALAASDSRGFAASEEIFSPFMAPEAATAQTHWQEWFTLCATGSGVGSIDACTKVIDDAKPGDPMIARVYVRRGFLKLGQQNMDAKADAEFALKLGESTGSAFALKGMAEEAMNDRDDAIADFSAAIADDPNNAYFRYARGNRYRVAGNLDLALVDFNRSLLIKPDFYMAIFSRAIVYAKLRLYQAAIDDYGSAIDLKPDESETYVNRGNLWITLEQFESALKDYNVALRVNPKDRLALTGLGYALLGLEHFDDAIADFDHVLHLDPNDANALVGRGNVRIQLGEFAEAIADLDKALSLRPQEGVIYNNRCFARAAWGREIDVAKSDCDKAIELMPDSTLGYSSRAVVYFRQGRFVEAIADSNSALAIYPKNANALYLRGVAELRLGDDANGQTDIAASKLLDPKIVPQFESYGIKR